MRHSRDAHRDQRAHRSLWTIAAGSIGLGALLLADAALTRADATGGARAAAHGGPAALFRQSGPPTRITRAAGPEVRRRRYVTLDARSAMQERSLELNLFSDLSLIVDRERTETMGGNGTVWIGRIRGQEGRAVLSQVGDVLVGNIRSGRNLYQIRYAGEGAHTVHEIDPSLLPGEECETPGFGAATGAAPEPDPGPLADPCDRIDMLVAYTTAARELVGGREAMEALIYVAMVETNVSFYLSDVSTRVYPAHLTEVSYTVADPNEFGIDIFRLQGTNDGYLDGIHALRDAYCADTVSLIVDAGEPCGRAYGIQDPAPNLGFAPNAFNIVRVDCAESNLSFEHELGHLMGARHDWYVDPTPTPFTYSHGHVNVAAQWRTIMAYPHKCWDSATTCVRLGLWSNPGIFLGFWPAGIPEGTSTSCTYKNLSNPPCDAEDYRTLNETSCTVANFRDRSVCADRSDVWMKDTWADTGDEPDPLTASEDMWASPYIWVRHDPGAEILYQHAHQNPIAGQVNYVNVKLHNDSSTTPSGHLKLYYAEASPALAWPTHFVQFADIPMGLRPDSVAIQAAAWTPPAAGHYCLLARWESPSDPMAFPEGPDVDLNTRRNNNIVWRNVNVVDLSSDETADVERFIMRNIDGRQDRVDLLVRLPDIADNFIRRRGRVILRLGALFDPWFAGGAPGQGFSLLPAAKSVEILDTQDGTALLADIPMNPGQEAPVNFRLTAPRVVATGPFPPTSDEEPPPVPFPARPVTEYRLDAVEIIGGLKVGGVGYDINVAPEGPAGAVPDGGARPGIPLTVERLGNGDLQLSWGTSCAATDTDYVVYQGTLGDFHSHKPVVCSTNGATTHTFAPAPGDVYYLVAPRSSLFEGSHGLKSDGLERTAGPVTCKPQLIAACP